MRAKLNLQWVQEETEDMDAYEIRDFVYDNDLTEQEEAYCWELAESKCPHCEGTQKIPRHIYDEDANEWVEDGYDECLCNK